MMSALMPGLSAACFCRPQPPLNGRLRPVDLAAIASFWNHIVVFAALTVCCLVIGVLLPAAAARRTVAAYVVGPSAWCSSRPAAGSSPNRRGELGPAQHRRPMVFCSARQIPIRRRRAVAIASRVVLIMAGMVIAQERTAGTGRRLSPLIVLRP
jgi:hypothetical protein